MPSLWAMNSSGRTVVFISISTMSMATDGMSAITTRLSEFAKARSTFPRTKLTLSFLSSRMRTVGSRSSMVDEENGSGRVLFAIDRGNPRTRMWYTCLSCIFLPILDTILLMNQSTEAFSPFSPSLSPFSQLPPCPGSHVDPCWKVRIYSLLYIYLTFIQPMLCLLLREIFMSFRQP